MNRFITLFVLYIILGCRGNTKTGSEEKINSKSDSLLNYSDSTYEGDGGTYKDIYYKDSLILKNWYDTLGNLKYQTPINLQAIQKTTFYFSSGRNYFDQDQIDTITFVTKGLPYYNRGVSIRGALLDRLTDSSYKIRVSKHYDDLRQLEIKILAHQKIQSTNTEGIVVDSILIPAK